MINFPISFPIDEPAMSGDGEAHLCDVDGTFVAEVLYAPNVEQFAELIDRPGIDAVVVALAFADWVRETLNDAVGRGDETDEFKFAAARERFNELLDARRKSES